MSDAPVIQVILLIGPAGSGKSSFIKSVTTEKVEVNGEKPCTIECKEYQIEVKINGHLKKFTIIDTPGFEDLADESLASLEKIAGTLKGMLPRTVYGAIYFHRITDGRLMGTARAVLEIFKAICGPQFYPRVAFVTTMWDTISRARVERYMLINDELEKRHMTLSKDSPKVFRRLFDDRESSIAVLEHFARLAGSNATAPPLLLVNEALALKKFDVRKTSAGKEIMKKTGSDGFCCVVS